MHGFGCRLLGYDIDQSQKLKQLFGIEYTSLERLCEESDIITLHTPLNRETRHLIDRDLLIRMKNGVMLVNTSRGAVVNTAELVAAVENGKVGFLAMDVYENEKGVFFYDHSGQDLNDHLIKKLLGMHNVMITPHQAFATREAITNIADTTFYNIDCWNGKTKSGNEVHACVPEAFS